jgi:hypothetical protein
VVSGLGRELKIWAPSHSRTPPKKIFRKAKIFPQNVGDGGGGGVGRPTFCFQKQNVPKIFQKLFLCKRGLNLVFQTFFDLNFLENSLIFNTFRNSSIPGSPSTQVGPTFLLFFGGCYTPTPPVVPALLIRQLL